MRIFPYRIAGGFTTGICLGLFSIALLSAASGNAPALQLDPSWPQPLPNKWMLGAVCGTALGPHDHIWILHRPKTLGENQKSAAPPVIEFDSQGKMVRAWGGPGAGYEWPTQEHGLFIDYKGNVWVSGVAGKDYGRILKFTTDGKFLMSIGTPLDPGEKWSNNSTTHLGRQPADMFVDSKTNELYVADGDGGAQRVIVFDAETGTFKRIWGAYGNKPFEGPPAKYDPSAPVPKTFLAGVHCVVIPKDGLVYVCDRNADRIQLFHKNGSFVKEAFIERSTVGNGSTFDIDFTPDQKYLYVADGANDKVWILQRDTLEIVGSFGESGEGPGQFRNVHSVTVDSKGNLYAGEVNGKRVQKFLPKQ
jgi:DNA-binding beta-propeller fold protein YncE